MLVYNQPLTFIIILISYCNLPKNTIKTKGFKVDFHPILEETKISSLKCFLEKYTETKLQRDVNIFLGLIYNWHILYFVIIRKVQAL